MNLPENYKKCFCGDKLTKRNRNAIKIKQPKERESVVYCCGKCCDKLRQKIEGTTKTGFFFYYDDIYPV